MLRKHIYKAISPALLAGIAITTTSCEEAENEADVPSLHEAFEGLFLIGGTLSDRMILDTSDPGYAIAEKHFNSLSPENCMKWGRMNPEPNVENYELAETFVRYGAANDQALVGHTLFWHSQTPDWVYKDEAGNDLSREALLARMRERATLMAERWGDEIVYWDVVNESIMGDGSWRKSKYQQIIGDDFTEQAFRIASEILPPNAQLLYNDYSMTDAGRRDAVVAMVKDFKAKGLRIDGIGMQGHWLMDFPDTKDIAESIQAFGSTGVKVHITELDLDLLGRASFFGADVDIRAIQVTPENNPYPDGVAPPAEEERFANRYGEIFETLVANADHIERVTFWGITDKTSWLNHFPVRGRTNFALLFDRQYQPKPAFYRVLETAKNRKE
ncbi:endo-1,4-beta-xylanase [Pelagicoccus sp. SDUM812002]|uniref:endo-1,4-beta-xylanase n=1 Tax=Pelagicoccus sp. SDUM812002 TaxID=3041266 RepID=UPI00280D0816|nr:endo-1,4-beta-xylanase [Pelagicoccus sp. SDUM812002]MDQ8184062.1 endo-1,4-beta-xylanase [Pelagicoccus sp. SDUM812002]